LASCQNLQYGIQNAVQVLTKIFCKKPQNKIAVLLQEAILSAVSSVNTRDERLPGRIES